jgi:hypothetical protein
MAEIKFRLFMETGIKEVINKNFLNNINPVIFFLILN